MEPVIGLDFGTTNSAIAVADSNGQAKKTFGAEKLRSGEELTTVAKGVALRALEES